MSHTPCSSSTRLSHIANENESPSETRLQPEDRAVYCLVCNKVLKNQGSFRNHRAYDKDHREAIGLPGESFRCLHCLKGFTRRGNYEYHVRKVKCILNFHAIPGELGWYGDAALSSDGIHPGLHLPNVDISVPGIGVFGQVPSTSRISYPVDDGVRSPLGPDDTRLDTSSAYHDTDHGTAFLPSSSRFAQYNFTYPQSFVNEAGFVSDDPMDFNNGVGSDVLGNNPVYSHSTPSSTQQAGALGIDVDLIFDVNSLATTSTLMSRTQDRFEPTANLLRHYHRGKDFGPR